MALCALLMLASSALSVELLSGDTQAVVSWRFDGRLTQFSSPTILLTEFTVPTISMFYGIIIRMYFAPGEHNPPHIHAYFGEHRATIALDTLDILEGSLPRKQFRLVQAWAELHTDELWANWRLAMSGETPYKIPPLQ